MAKNIILIFFSIFFSGMLNASNNDLAYNLSFDKEELAVNAAEGCQKSGGKVSKGKCCPDASDFPDTCTVGNCMCNPETSITVKKCYCPENMCFDGTKCVPNKPNKDE